MRDGKKQNVAAGARSFGIHVCVVDSGRMWGAAAARSRARERGQALLLARQAEGAVVAEVVTGEGGRSTRVRFN
jgi:hypothetical protein